jgi:hypothetical protein
MSAETKAALDAAVEAHYSDEYPGVYCAEWVLQCWGQAPGTSTNYYLREWPDSQPIHHTGGLLDYAITGHAAYLASNSSDADEDDDD